MLSSLRHHEFSKLLKFSCQAVSLHNQKRTYQKALIIIFKGILVSRNCLRPKSVPFNEFYSQANISYSLVITLVGQVERKEKYEQIRIWLAKIQDLY